MSFRRVDPYYIADDSGEQVWMPSADAMVGPLGSTGSLPIKPEGAFDTSLEEIQMPPDQSTQRDIEMPVDTDTMRSVGVEEPDEWDPNHIEMGPDYAGRDPRTTSNYNQHVVDEMYGKPTVWGPPAEEVGYERGRATPADIKAAGMGLVGSEYDVSDRVAAMIAQGGGQAPVDSSRPGMSGMSGMSGPSSGPSGPGGVVDPWAQGGQGPAPGLSPLGRGPRTSAEASAMQRDAFNEKIDLARSSATAKFEAEKAAASAGVDAEETYGKQIAEVEKVRQREYAVADRKAVQEQTRLVKLQQEHSKKTADSSNYFKNRSTFSKIAWIVATMSGAIAAGHDQSKNMALKMMNEAIKEDMAGQNEAIKREGDALTGRVNAAQADRADLKRDNARQSAEAMMLKFQAVRSHAQALAKVPGSEAHRAGLAAVEEYAAGEQMKIIESQGNAVRAQEQALADRRARAWEAKLSRTHAENLAQQRRTWEVLDREDQQAHGREMAQVSVSNAEAAANAKKAADNAPGPDGNVKGYSSFSPRTGVRVVEKDANGKIKMGPDGKPAIHDLQVKDENREATQKAVDMFRIRQTTLVDLRREVEKAGEFERFMGTSPVLESIVARAGGAEAKALNSGAMSEHDRTVGYQSMLGYDPNSFYSKLKSGRNKAEVLKLIDKALSETPQRARGSIEAAAKVKLPKNLEVQAILDEDQIREDSPDPTDLEMRARLGISGGAPKPVTGAEDARDRENKAKRMGLKEADVFPALPPELSGVVDLEVIRRGVQAHPHSRDQVIKTAQRALDDFKSDPKNWAPGTSGLSDHLRAGVDQLGHRLEAIDRDPAARDKYLAILRDMPVGRSQEGLEAWINQRAKADGVVMPFAEVQEIARKASKDQTLRAARRMYGGKGEDE